MSFDPVIAWGHDDVQDYEHKVYVRFWNWLFEVGWELDTCIDCDTYIIRLTRLKNVQ